MGREKTGWEDAEERAVVRLTLAGQVAASLRKEIFTGKHRPGDKLPPERELAERFRISRSTLRKALMLLAQEGWIEVVQGRSNAVRDFRTSVGIEALPDLFFSCPEAVVSVQLLETMAENCAWLYQQIFTAAAKKAGPKDEPRLMALLDRQAERLSLVRFYENDFALFQELTRIGGNLVLQMTYNSQVRLSRQLLARGIVKDRPAPLPQYRETNAALIRAACAGDVETIKKIMENSSRDVMESFLRIYGGLGLNRDG